MLLCLKEPISSSSSSSNNSAAFSNAPQVPPHSLHLMHLSWIALDFEQYARFLSAYDPLGAFSSNSVQICEPFLSVHFDRIVGLFSALHRQRVHLQLEEAYKRYFARFSPFHDTLADDSKARFACLWRRGTVAPEQILEALTLAVASHSHPDWHFVVRQVTRVWMYDLLQRWDGYGSIEDIGKKDLFLSESLHSSCVTRINKEIMQWDSDAYPREFVQFVLVGLHGKEFWLNGRLPMHIGKTDRMLKANYLPLCDPDYYALIVWRLQRLGINNFAFAIRYYAWISRLAEFDLIGAGKEKRENSSGYRSRLRYFESKDAVSKVKNILKLITCHSMPKFVNETVVLDEGFRILERMLLIGCALEQGSLPNSIWINVQALQRGLKRCASKGPLDPLFFYNKNGEQVQYLLYRWAIYAVKTNGKEEGSFYDNDDGHGEKMCDFGSGNHPANEHLTATFHCPYEQGLKAQMREQWSGYAICLILTGIVVGMNALFVWTVVFGR